MPKIKSPLIASPDHGFACAGLDQAGRMGRDDAFGDKRFGIGDGVHGGPLCCGCCEPSMFLNDVQDCN
jgi:hypothetical protein